MLQTVVHVVASSTPKNHRTVCGGCGAVLVVRLSICPACGASLSGPLAPATRTPPRASRPAGPAPRRGALASAGWAIGGLAVLAAALVLLATLSGCASTPETPPPPPPRPVPSLVGQPRVEAEEALVRAGFEPRYSYRYAEVESDLVVEQSPEAGMPHTPAEPVEVVVATKHPRSHRAA